MFQELEGNRPLVISRNFVDRPRSNMYRWVMPDDWSPAWNFQRSLLTGLSFGVFSSVYYQFHTPVSQLLAFYQFPNSFGQLRIMLSQVFKMDSFQRGLGSSLALQGCSGLTFQTARFYLWRDFAGGYPTDPDTFDIAWGKKAVTAITVGFLTSWIPVPFHNIMIRYEQDRILPAEHSRGYRGYMHTAVQMARHDGFFPFIRSAFPLMAEKTWQTASLFYWTDIIKEKCHHFQHYGSNNGGFSDFTMKTVYLGFGSLFGLIGGYPFVRFREIMEQFPLNSRGEPAFASYSEGFWRLLSEHYNPIQLMSGFWPYVVRCGPPLFLTMWFADSIGLLDIQYRHGVIMPQ
jgi:hypothetical protein